MGNYEDVRYIYNDVNKSIRTDGDGAAHKGFAGKHESRSRQCRGLRHCTKGDAEAKADV